MAEHVAVRTSSPSYQAYQILHWGFVALPILAGMDKFVHFLANWDQYLAPIIPQILHLSGHTFMMVVGVIEIIAGLFVAVKPRLGSLVVAAWLWGIILNLLLAGLGWLCLLLVIPFWRARSDELRVTFLAVGHGGCTVIETPGWKSRSL